MVIICLFVDNKAETTRVLAKCNEHPRTRWPCQPIGYMDRHVLFVVPLNVIRAYQFWGRTVLICILLYFKIIKIYIVYKTIIVLMFFFTNWNILYVFKFSLYILWIHFYIQLYIQINAVIFAIWRYINFRLKKDRWDEFYFVFLTPS